MKTIRELCDNLGVGGVVTYVPEGMGSAVIDDVAIREIYEMTDAVEVAEQWEADYNELHEVTTKLMLKAGPFQVDLVRDWDWMEDEFVRCVSAHVEVAITKLLSLLVEGLTLDTLDVRDYVDGLFETKGKPTLSEAVISIRRALLDATSDDEEDDE